MQKKSENLVPRIEFLECLLVKLGGYTSIKKKVEILENLPVVIEYLKDNSHFSNFLKKSSSEVQMALLSILAIGEGPIVFRGFEEGGDTDSLIHTLIDLEKFYDTIGGVIGYHLTILRLILEGSKHPNENNVEFKKPEGIDLTNDTQEVRDAIRWGIEQLPSIAEIYPIGGAGDRLNLQDPETRLPLPAAQLMFGGRTLLEGLIRDLQAREFLYYKFFGKEVVTPIALMTSHEKNNDNLIRKILIKNHWFGRSEDNFKLFCQPLVPVVTIEGHWSMTDVLKPTLKPGGHGVLWKIAEDNEIFNWFASKKRIKALVRQINNPIAGLDFGLIAFLGIGIRENKVFGFASCFRLLNASEGVVVLVEKKVNNTFRYTISNIEYTNFKQHGIQDAPPEIGSPYSLYPANTNILFVDLEEIRKITKESPIPGMLLNLKSTAPFIDAEGKEHAVKAGRLETTMQNISDYIHHDFDQRIGLAHIKKLRTYLTYNDRRKTISVTKKFYEANKPMLETPEGCFYDVQLNAYDLLKHHCGFDLPDVGNEDQYLKYGPGFIFQYHPALGPMYSIISQKLIRGKMKEGSELQLEIAEIFSKNLRLDGSLLVFADDLKGKCHLEDVSIINLGIDRNAKNVFWKNEISRQEEVRIEIKGSGEFVAKGVVFKGSHLIEVPDGYRVTATMQRGQISYQSEKITEPTWQWNYAFDSENNILLRKDCKDEGTKGTKRT
jgi:hypothetical protein